MVIYFSIYWGSLYIYIYIWAANHIWYITQLTGCSYLVLQSRNVFWGLTSFSNAALVFSHTHWRFIRIRAGTGGWRRRGSIRIDLSASSSSLLLPPNSGYCLLKAVATMHPIPMVRQLRTLRVHPFGQVAAFTWLKWLRVCLPLFSASAIISPAPSFRPRWFSNWRHMHPYCSGTSRIDVIENWHTKGIVLVGNGRNTIRSANFEFWRGLKFEDLGRDWSVVVNDNFDARCRTVLDAGFVKMALHHAPQHIHFGDADLVVEDWSQALAPPAKQPVAIMLQMLFDPPMPSYLTVLRLDLLHQCPVQCFVGSKMAGAIWNEVDASEFSSGHAGGHSFCQ